MKSLDWWKHEQSKPMPPTLESRSSKHWLKLKNLWQTLLQYLTQPPELRVWYSSDRQGNIWWSACDPVTGRSIYRVSEQQIRIWIEQRY